MPCLITLADMQHFRNTLTYIQTRQRQDGEKEDTEEDGVKRVDWDQVDIVGGALKMGLNR